MAASSSENTELSAKIEKVSDALTEQNKLLGKVVTHLEGSGDAASAQDETVTWPKKKSGSSGQQIRNIGLPSTPFEMLVKKYMSEGAELEDAIKLAQAVEARQPTVARDGPQRSTDPNAMPTAGSKTPSFAYAKESNVAQELALIRAEKKTIRETKHQLGLPLTEEEEEEEVKEEEDDLTGVGMPSQTAPGAADARPKNKQASAFPTDNAMPRDQVNPPMANEEEEEEEEDSPMNKFGGNTGISNMPSDQGDKQNYEGVGNYGNVSKSNPAGDKNYPKSGGGYGFTKEGERIGRDGLSNYERQFLSTLNRREAEMFMAGRKMEKRLGMISRSGVLQRAPIAARRESRDSDMNPQNVMHGGYRMEDGTFAPKYSFTMEEFARDIDFTIPNMNDHLRVFRGESNRLHALTRVPTLSPPPLFMRNTQPRRDFLTTLEMWNGRMQEKQATIAGGRMYRGSGRAFMEAAPTIATTTSGAALGVEEMTPALVVPTNLAALMRDTYLYKALPQGVDRARFQTITALAMGALTQNTAPSSTAPTLATVDITTSPRGYLLQLSFEMERKGIGPILDALILAGRLGELYDEDFLAVGAGQAFETSSLPTSGQLYGTGNQIFGTGVASESLVTSGMTMSLNVLTDAQETIKAQGYSPDNLVVVMAPKQFRDLLRDANINRYLSFGPGTDNINSMLAQGVIPELLGIEIRQSTLPVSRASGSGSPAQTTYHAWVYKKGLTAGLAASRDVMIETFRDIEAGSTWLKVHYDMGIGVIHPNSLVELVTS